MSLLFDTNALSEPTKKAPNAGFLEFDLRAAKACGELTARLPKLPVRDSLIAAVALSRSLTVVTRDLVTFAAAGCKVITPWK
jgi:predicted nucleic acid-binding protein